MRTKDVLIIGAGAAGSTAAFHLAKAGNNVTLLEQHSKENLKPCGGGMAAAVQEWFPFDLMPVVDEVINRVDFTWCLSDLVIAPLPGSSPFWIVQREKLDSFITEQAINAGAELLRPFKVTNLQKHGNYWQVTSKDGQQLEAKAVVIADGSRSPWPEMFGLGPKKQHYAFTTSVRLEGRGNIEKGTTKFEFGLVHHGFAWAFPLAKGVNVGIGSFIGQQALNSDAVLDKLLPSLGFDAKEGNRKDSLLRVWNGHSPLNGDGIVVVGDAGSLCDPFLAEGLRPALMSGYEAANSLNYWLKGDNKNLNDYTNKIQREWGDSMAWGRRISQVFYRFPKVGYQLGIKRPTAPQRIAEILSGKLGYGDIATRVIRRLLFKRT
ncbi:geranylgeranyl reductase family protein [Prochlorococcus sp. MIT 1307]|uniref:NAD(P)/FAD-dependent oxidoreductase n=1 Tax=Prochlorococcus sp. MIT 1307 TaxID=3096219 RepID=UPI002A762613|nr:geranylgeranyl reductase family protein [Prochlorococcus sp. MIT 1307]